MFFYRSGVPLGPQCVVRLALSILDTSALLPANEQPLDDTGTGLIRVDELLCFLEGLVRDFNLGLRRVSHLPERDDLLERLAISLDTKDAVVQLVGREVSKSVDEEASDILTSSERDLQRKRGRQSSAMTAARIGIRRRTGVSPLPTS